MKTLRLLLGDQLNPLHSWFREKNDDILYCLFEMRQETDYVRHHIQKIIACFAAMRHLAASLQHEGHRVVYLPLDHPDNTGSLEDNLSLLIRRHGIEQFEYQLPDEWRLDEQLNRFCQSCGLPTRAVDTEHFLTSRDSLDKLFGQRPYLMETFYRDIRRRHDILLENGRPVGGQWNYDAENRKKMPKDHQPPPPLLFSRDVRDIHRMILEAGVNTIGSVDPARFTWPVTREESLDLLSYFTTNGLVHFGDFQDAMTPEHWALYHARLSFSLNFKLLSPMEVVQAVLSAWKQRRQEISISQVEGFVRQVIGWREYIRGIYWARMPSYANLNFLAHSRPLPAWFWNGETKMACLRHTVRQSLAHAYAHHIQRLMVTGNFCLLAGIDPDAVDQWYLGIYIDAIEWVELPNTRGMSQFADGGVVGTKPYCASANYMDKMGHYCTGCHYDKKARTGDRACPLNSLYWHFMDRHRTKLERNPRIGMAYRTWDRTEEDTRESILRQADAYLRNLEDL
ncbi:MAG: hypothetical protein RLY31_1580 [Bacteroidota bacterium]|jgi:deoxyribodipyrimidine photolyase-related protein